MDAALLTVLRHHNPWLDQPAAQRQSLIASLPEPFLPRRRRLDLQRGRAELVIGPRQAGKSTWIRETLSRHDVPVLILHAEEPRLQELGRSPAELLAGLGDVLQPETLLFFEEVQHLENAPLLIKGLVDLQPGRRLVATGSSSFTFAARTRESLAGRARRSRLLPFSLEEVGASLPGDLAPAVRDSRWSDLWTAMVRRGGFPRAWLDPDPETTLRYLVEAFVLRDTSDLHRIDRPSVFRKVIELAAADVGNLVNLSEWASLSQASRNTVTRYLEIAEEAHVLRRVAPFSGGRRAEVTGTPKVYFLDNGLRNAVFGGFGALEERADRGPLWENAVYGELVKRLRLLDEVRFWRSKNGAEVDFVVRRGERLVGIEVKAGPLGRPRLSRGARSFLAAYKPACFGVVNASLRQDVTVEDVPVRFVRPWDIDVVLEALGP